ncbi:hypothetical protein E4T47_05900 [Aureobasidium subglaciale]|nr:hypothetical protein E4T47_05900 [Aureobasidium subglaciale]
MTWSDVIWRWWKVMTCISFRFLLIPIEDETLKSVMMKIKCLLISCQIGKSRSAGVGHSVKGLTGARSFCPGARLGAV